MQSVTRLPEEPHWMRLTPPGGSSPPISFPFYLHGSLICLREPDRVRRPPSACVGRVRRHLRSNYSRGRGRMLDRSHGLAPGNVCILTLGGNYTEQSVPTTLQPDFRSRTLGRADLLFIFCKVEGRGGEYWIDYR